MEHMEIERKWLMDAFPNLSVCSECRMEQVYLAFVPNTVRVRKKLDATGESYKLTIKGKGTLQRTEVELPLDAGQYNALAALAAAPAAAKLLRTYTLPGGETLECSLVDEGQPTAFYYAEVEFGSVEAAQRFTPPPYLGREVTEEPGWTMAEYCRRKGGELG